MKKGKLSIEKINKNYTLIDKTIGFKLYEHNVYGEDRVICVDELHQIYCYTDETLLYTKNNSDEFEWYSIAK